MIIVQLTGGLGNQLFQYAIGRTLAVMNNTQLKIDLSFFETYEWHEYSLAPFSIEAKVATVEEVNTLTKLETSFLEKVRRKLFGVLPIIIKEKGLNYNSYYLKAGSNAYLKGYWQSSKYFLSQEMKIRKEFEIKLPPSSSNTKLLNEIMGCESVSLHIRRGNYASIEAVNKFHGTTKMSYYSQAMVVIESRCENPVYFIFSDDIGWARENLRLTREHVFVDINTDKTDYEDLRLMKSCKHSIVANSTFSWWGAWLNPNPDKIVIAPKQWFANEEMNQQTNDLIPAEWIRL